MSDRHVEELQKVYEAILKDATYAFPTLGGEFERDLIRLRSGLKSRGLRFATVDLPAVGKHLDRCLAMEEYSPSGLPFTKRYTNGVVIPKFLRGLYLLVFEDTGCLRKDCNVEAIFFLRQLLYVAKKAELNCDDEYVQREVLDFIRHDESLPEPDGFWDSSTPDFDDVLATFTGFRGAEHYLSKIRGVDGELHQQLSSFLKVLDTVSSIIATTLGSYSFHEWSFKHGPGAVSEVVGPKNKYFWYNWSNRLENAFPIADCGFHNYSGWVDRCNAVSPIGSVEPEARLIAVPKTFTKPRLIAAEPSEHQWCQQNIWNYFDARVAGSWIRRFVRFRDQSFNQDLCRLGSVDGRLATVDLSAASDSVSCLAVGQAFRANPGLLLALQATRTRYLGQTLAQSAPAKIKLRKFSTMGNACTFPVESLVFLGICLAVVLTKRKIQATPKSIQALVGEVAVFGDDIVIPEDSRALLFDALRVLDFKVNTDKSFWTGRFRESCGVDAFRGENVTPVYWRRLVSRDPESIVSAVEVSNNLYNRFLLNTSMVVRSTIRKALPTVAMDSGVCGQKTRVRAEVSTFHSRWNAAYQRSEALVPMLIAKVKKLPITDASALLQYFTEKPSPYLPWRSGVVQRPILRLKYGWVPTEDLGFIT